MHPAVGFRGEFILGFGLALETSAVAVIKGTTCNIRSWFHSTEHFSHDSSYLNTATQSSTWIATGLSKSWIALKKQNNLKPCGVVFSLPLTAEPLAVLSFYFSRFLPCSHTKMFILFFALEASAKEKNIISLVIDM